MAVALEDLLAVEQAEELVDIQVKVVIQALHIAPVEMVFLVLVAEAEAEECELVLILAQVVVVLVCLGKVLMEQAVQCPDRM